MGRHPTALPGALSLALAAITQPAPAVTLFCLQWGAIQVPAPLFAGDLNERLPSSYRATVLSLLTVARSTDVGLVGLIVGGLAATALPAAFALMGVLVLGGALLFRINERHLDSRPE